VSADGAASRSFDRLPEVLGREPRADALWLALRVPPELGFFPGHFPAQGILPGVVQIDWAIHFGRQHWPLCGRLVKMEAVKFQQLIKPGFSVQLSLQYAAHTHKLHFQFSGADANSGVNYSSGRLVFAR
jgi:3-hydroxymyristoyl/3-hydroxydecanoyl-(acyl carrier protein) dehydratase